MLLFVWLIFNVESYLSISHKVQDNISVFTNANNNRGYILRFAIVHFLTYFVVGGIFYKISGYSEVLETMEIFILWGPLENPSTVLLVLIGQIVRGGLLALMLYPFYQIYINTKRGWALLYLLMAGLTILGSPLFITELISIEGSFSDFFKSLAVGIPEIFSQMLIFSLVFFYWQKHAESKQLKSLLNNMSVFLT